MKLKSKLILKYPLIGFRNWRSRAIARKIRKSADEERYPEAWKATYVLKKAKKLVKNLQIDLQVKGYENLPKAPFVLVANHSSMMDPVLIIKALENLNEADEKPVYQPCFLAKKSLQKNKQFKGYLGILSTFFVSRTNPREALEQIEKFGEYVKENSKVGIIFPEGTRSKDGKIQEFKSGAFRIAKKRLLNIVPVSINNALEALNLDRNKKAQIEVIFGKPIKANSFLTIDNKALANKVQKQVESNFKWVKSKRQNLEKMVS